MIDWIDAMCRTWGYQKQRILYVANTDCRPAGCLMDGPPFSGNASSFFGRITGERVAAGEKSDIDRCPPEVLIGDALKVSRALKFAINAKHLSEKQYEALFVQYVIRGPLKVKMDKLRISRKVFYERIHRSHRILKPWLREGDNVTVEGVTASALYGATS